MRNLCVCVQDGRSTTHGHVHEQVHKHEASETKDCIYVYVCVHGHMANTNSTNTPIWHGIIISKS